MASVVKAVGAIVTHEPGSRAFRVMAAVADCATTWLRAGMPRAGTAQRLGPPWQSGRSVAGGDAGEVLQRVVEVVILERRELEVLAHMGRDR